MRAAFPLDWPPVAALLPTLAAALLAAAAIAELLQAQHLVPLLGAGLRPAALHLASAAELAVAVLFLYRHALRWGVGASVVLVCGRAALAAWETARDARACDCTPGLPPARPGAQLLALELAMAGAALFLVGAFLGRAGRGGQRGDL